MKLKKKAKCAASSDGGTESELELKDRASGEEASGRESCLESNDNAKVAEEPTIEQKGGAEEPPEGETASAPVCKYHAMLQDEQDRPHYNPHQGGHSRVVYRLHTYSGHTHICTVMDHLHIRPKEFHTHYVTSGC